MSLSLGFGTTDFQPLADPSPGSLVFFLASLAPCA